MVDRGAPTRRRLVVVGNGMAGIRAVEEILARGQRGGEQFEITVFGDEPYGNYNRILLSNVLAGVEDETQIFLNPMSWYDEYGIDLRAGVGVERVDRYGKRLLADDGSVTPYDVLVLATGSRPFFPPIPGMCDEHGRPCPGVFGFRTLDDTRAMIAYAAARGARGGGVAVVGGGLLGLEAARGLQRHGGAVHVVHAAPTLMNAQLDTVPGQILRRQVEALGIAVHTGARTSAVDVDETTGEVIGLRFADGGTLACEMVVVAAGIRPNAELAVLAGLTVERAIVVDDQMRSVDDDDIFAVGECAQHRGDVYGLVAPLFEQATVLADVVTGCAPRAAYHGSKTATKLKVAGLDVAAMGLKAPQSADDETVVFSEPRRGVYKSVVIRDGKLVGATLLGDIGKVAFLTQAFDRGLPLPDERLELMFDLGTPAADVGISELAADAQVCNCNGVSKAAICAAVTGGARSVGAVVAATRAGKGCGSCKTLVGQVVEWAAEGALEVDPAADWYVPCIPMDKPTLVAAIRERELKAVSAVFAELAVDGRAEASAKMPLASLLRTIWGPGWVDERDALFVNDRVHANIQKDGTFSVVPQIAGGVTTPDQLRRIAEVADRYDVPMVKITGGQRIDLLGVRKQDLPAVWADLDMPSGFAYGKSFRTVKTCVGIDFCRFGLGDSTALGVRVEKRFQGLESPAKLKLAVTGCPRNCAEALVKDVGVVAVEGGRWEIYVGGAAGAHVRKGDLLATVDTDDEVVTLIGRFLQYYRENAKWLERTYAFVPRLGFDRVRAVVVDDAEGLAASLDAAVQASVDGYRDPWQEGRAPAVAGQFRPSLPLVELPTVGRR